MSLPSLYWYSIFQALVLLIAANGAPVITHKVLGNRLARPMDNGLILSDGYPFIWQQQNLARLFFSGFLCHSCGDFIWTTTINGCIVRCANHSRGFNGELHQTSTGEC